MKPQGQTHCMTDGFRNCTDVSTEMGSEEMMTE